MEKTILFWHTYRMLILIGICIYMRRLLMLYSNMTGVSVLAFIVGQVVYHSISSMFDKLLCKCFRLKTMNSLDEFFLFNSNDSGSNVCGVLVMEKLQYEDFKHWVKNKLYSLPWTKPKLTQLFGKHYLKELTDEEFAQRWEGSVIKQDGVKGRFQLQAFIDTIIGQKIDLYNSLPTKWYVIEDFEEDSSAILVLGNHAFCDGIQFMAMLKLLSQDKKKELKLPGIPAWKMMIGYLLLPFLVLQTIWFSIRLPVELNHIKKRMPAKPKRHMLISDNIDSKLFFKARKEVFKCSENTACQAIVGQTIKEYSRRMGDPNLEQIMFKSTLQTQYPPMKLEEIQFGNHWVQMSYPLRTSDDINENIQFTRENFRKYIGSMNLLGSWGFVTLINKLPFNLANLVYIFNSKRITMGLSSVPDLGDGFDFNGMKSKAFFATGAQVAESLSMFFFFNCNGVIKGVLINDRTYIKKPEMFMEIFEDKMAAFNKHGEES